MACQVWVSFVGPSGRLTGDSGVLRLDNPKNNFETGDTDVFHVKAPDCGKLQRLRLWHDNKGLGAAWHCEIITVGAARCWALGGLRSYGCVA